jgi:hypothetical protein
MKLYAFFNLLTNAFLWTTVRWIESIVAAERTTTGTDFAVTVWATEASVDADFLHTTAENTSEI